MPLFGAHMSVAGGLEKAFDHLEAVEGKALQIFTKNQRRWKSPPLGDETAQKFLGRWDELGNPPVASHGSYLLNLATPDPTLAVKSIENLVDELERCRALRIPYAIIHPGSHVGEGVETGLKNLTQRLGEVFSRTQGVTVLLENTAGAGNGLGSTFEELARVIDMSATPERLGVCFDTCHAFAAGYDLRGADTYREAMDNLVSLVGLEKVNWFHLNDSLGELGSHKDRHGHIGKEQIGLAGFSNLVNDPRFKDHPMVLETPKDETLADDRENLACLRSLLD